MTYVVTYKGQGFVVDSLRDAAATMIDLWLNRGPDPDIRTDRWLDGRKEGITAIERYQIIAYVHSIRFLRR